jgi:hypothetical protein
MVKKIFNIFGKMLYSSEKNEEYNNQCTCTCRIKKEVFFKNGFMITGKENFFIIINLIKVEHDIYQKGEIVETKEFHSEKNDDYFYIADFCFTLKDGCFDIIEIKYPQKCMLCL